jgi:hypothetical protein
VLLDIDKLPHLKQLLATDALTICNTKKQIQLGTDIEGYKKANRREMQANYDIWTSKGWLEKAQKVFGKNITSGANNNRGSPR